jgi:hypothetical protein
MSLPLIFLLEATTLQLATTEGVCFCITLEALQVVEFNRLQNFTFSHHYICEMQGLT